MDDVNLIVFTDGIGWCLWNGDEDSFRSWFPECPRYVVLAPSVSEFTALHAITRVNRFIGLVDEDGFTYAGEIK